MTKCTVGGVWGAALLVAGSAFASAISLDALEAREAAEAAGLQRVDHVVGPTETLPQIAATYRVPALQIQEWNGLDSLAAPTGTTLAIFLPAKQADEILNARAADTAAQVQLLNHRTEAGETLSSIAERYNVNVRDIVLWNSLTDAYLEEGQLLALYVDEGIVEKESEERAHPLITSTRAPVIQPEVPAPLETEVSPGGEQPQPAIQVDLPPVAVSPAPQNSAPEAPVQATPPFRVASSDAAVDAAVSTETGPALNEVPPPPRVTPELPEPVVHAAPGETPTIGEEVARQFAREREPVAVPRSLPGPSPIIEEVMVMQSEELHGFSAEDLRLAQQEVYSVPQEYGKKALPAGGFPEYLIGPADVLEFLSFNDPALNREEIVVRYDGYVSLPLIPDVNVAGKTREDAEALIQDAYADVFRDPEVSLTVKVPESKTYSVMGDVALPGRYAYVQPTTLLDAISLAGGLRPRTGDSGGIVGIAGQVTQAVVLREVNGERIAIPYDLRGLDEPGPFEGDAPVFYGDMIYVPEGVNLVYVLGEMTDPFTIELTQGLTLLRALALGGGFNSSTARLREVVVIRETDPEHSDVYLMNVRKMLNTGQDFELLAGDVIYVPRKRILRLAEFIERFTGSISPLLQTYIDAVTARFVYDIQSESLDALEDANVDIGVKSPVVRSPAVRPQPTGRTIRPQNLGR